MNSLALLSALIECFAVEIRNLQRSDILESVETCFDPAHHLKNLDQIHQRLGI